MLFGKYLVVQQDLPPLDFIQLYIINVETGVCGRIKNQFSEFWDSEDEKKGMYFFRSDSIMLRNEEIFDAHKLSDIFEELDSL